MNRRKTLGMLEKTRQVGAEIDASLGMMRDQLEQIRDLAPGLDGLGRSIEGLRTDLAEFRGELKGLAFLFGVIGSMMALSGIALAASILWWIGWHQGLAGG
jgi:hypothetical protein